MTRKGYFFRTSAGLILALSLAASESIASTVDIQGPAGSNFFGLTVTVLPNGNFVVTDPGYQSDFGAVYLYDSQGTLISTLTGSSELRRIGNDGVVVLSTGDFVVCSEPFGSGPGATTRVSGTTGMNGTVSAENSLIGFTPAFPACGSVLALSDGNYVVLSAFWKNETGFVGAATWCSGIVGCHGLLSESNSLTGGRDGDLIGITGVALPGGKYAIASPYWGHDGMSFVGAVTVCVAPQGCTGKVTAANSLIGGQQGDYVGSGRLFLLPDGDFLVNSPIWHGPSNEWGALTRVHGNTASTGEVSTENSMTGDTANDFLDLSVTALASGDYVVAAPYWDRGPFTDAGAAVLCHQVSGCPKKVTSENSLVGDAAHDQIAAFGVTALPNGNYVVDSAFWGRTGDYGGFGAATFCAASGCTGSVTALNSLVGHSAFDMVANTGVVALTDGNYVVGSFSWNSVGASTWCDGALGCTGEISSDNSLIGAGDGVSVGARHVALSNGSYVVYSVTSGLEVTGSATWAHGAKNGVFSDENSFTGIETNSTIAEHHVFSVANGNFVARAEDWSDGVSYNLGAVALLRGYGPQPGTFSADNSVFGGFEFGGGQMPFAYNAFSDTLIVGRPHENIVTLLKADQLFFAGFQSN